MDVALVLAGRSFLGRHLLDLLTQRQIACRATSRRPQADEIACDLTNPDDIEAVVGTVRPRWLFACAGATADTEPAALQALHVTAMETLLRTVARVVPATVTVLFGSAAEYGPVAPERLPIREDTPLSPCTAYGQSKVAQLAAATRLAAEHGLRVVLARPFNLIGPCLGRHYFAASLCARLLLARQGGERGPVPINNGTATRDWVDVRDAAEAVLRLALTAPPERGTVAVYNIATGQETAVLALAQHLCRLAGDFAAVDAGAASSRSAIDRSCGDASRLRQTTGWRPTVSWQQSAAALWESMLTESSPRPTG